MTVVDIANKTENAKAVPERCDQTGSKVCLRPAKPTTTRKTPCKRTCVLLLQSQLHIKRHSASRLACSRVMEIAVEARLVIPIQSLVIDVAKRHVFEETKSLPYPPPFHGGVSREDPPPGRCNSKESQGRYLPVKNTRSIEHLFSPPMGVVAPKIPTGGGDQQNPDFLMPSRRRTKRQ